MTRIITIAIIALFLAACGGTDKEAARKKQLDSVNAKIIKLEKKRNELITAADTAIVERIYPVKVQKLQIDTISKMADYTANLLPYEEVYLAPATPGRIDKIYVEVGDRVNKGQKLALMDQTQLKQAKIQLAQLKTDFERMTVLKESNSISAQQFDQMKTQLEVTESNVEFLEENTVIIAPFNGVITGKFYENGEMFSGGPNTQAGKAAIVTIQQISTLKAIINVSERYFPKVNEGDKVEITSETYNGKVFFGTIELIHPTIDPMTRSFKAEVKIANKQKLLRPGMFSRVAVQIEETTAFMVPASTILQQEGTNNRYIFVNNNGIAKRINIKTGERFDNLIEIISDEIEVGDQLIVSGQTTLMNGFKLNVTNN